MYSVITIGRQFGSGGRQVGKLLAEKWQIPYYDKEILALAAKESGIGAELFESHDEKPTKSLLFSLVMGMQFRESPGEFYMDMPINHKIFLAQFDTIRRIASQGPCVIVGRCADYVLRDNPRAVNIFIHAPLKDRVKRAVEVYQVPEDKAEETVLKTDKQRASYYNYYATGKWGQVENHHLSIDSAAVGIEGAAEIVASFVTAREALQKAEA